MDLLDELRRLPLFELFSEQQLTWVVKHSKVVDVAEGAELFAVGDRPKEFWVLLDGELQILRPMDHGLVEVARSSSPGVWAGVVPYVFEESQITARVLRASRMLEVADADVRHMVDVGFPIAKHLMLGVTAGSQRWSDRVAERERMTALGRLSAGLAHELNNPASAARRAAAQLRTAVATHEAAALDVACAVPGPDLAERLAAMRGEVEGAIETALGIAPLVRSAREDEVGDWLVGAGLQQGHELAPTIVDAGLSASDLERLAPPAGSDGRTSILRWLAASADTASLLREIEFATIRIADLVQAVKGYSYMDRADMAVLDVRSGLEDTLRMLKPKLAGITVERDYDPALPTITAHGGQLNQVWTNLIDNAIDALDGHGTIRIGAHGSGNGIVVTIEDDGPGIPDGIVHRVFEPFFTTKGIGKGSGLGLDIARRIVTDTTGGQLAVESRPGRTVFRISLPATAPP